MPVLGPSSPGNEVHVRPSHVAPVASGKAQVSASVKSSGSAPPMANPVTGLAPVFVNWIGSGPRMSPTVVGWKDDVVRG